MIDLTKLFGDDKNVPDMCFQKADGHPPSQSRIVKTTDPANHPVSGIV
jgi:hypothetical protein